MKTVCKKLLCLMLVAMMLISAVPFAFAAGNPVPVEVIVQAADGSESTLSGEVYDDLTSVSAIVRAFGVDLSVYNIAKYDIRKGEDKTVGTADDPINLAGATMVWVRVIQDPDVCTHPASKLTTTNTATCGKDGVKTVKCECGEVISTENVSATGNHNFVGADCTGCDATRNPEGSITFHYMTSADVWTAKTIYAYEVSEEIDPPAEADDVRGYAFLGWSSVRNGAAEVSEGGSICWNNATSSDYWAVYDDDKDDNLVHLTVKVAYYVNGDLNRTETLLTSDDFPKDEDNNQMYRWLYGDGFKEINQALFANGNNADYKWNEVFYLNNKGTEKVNNDEKLMDDGNKIVYVVLNSKDYIEANVQLYVHKTQSATVYDIIDMNGYTAGDKVTRADVIDILEDEDYSYSSLSYLYTQTEWENLLNGDNADGDKDITITHNGTTKIHVIAKNAKTSSSKADTSNPKTGDSIMIAVTTMTLAAAAVVTMVELKKRKMI